MNKASGFNRLGRKSSHRKALSRNLVISLFQHERVETTLAKAKAIRRKAEKMITRAKVDSVHNRRLIARDVSQKDVLHKLFSEISPRYKARAGGYTRVYKLGPRNHDAAEMALLELVGEEVEGKGRRRGARRAKVSEAAPAPLQADSGTRQHVAEQQPPPEQASENPEPDAVQEIGTPEQAESAENSASEQPPRAE